MGHLRLWDTLVCELNERERLRMLGLADRLWQMLRRGYAREDYDEPRT